MTSLLDVPRGVVAPRIRCVPPYVSSAGPEVRELAARAGLVLDPWEADALDDALGEREDGDWAAFEVGVVVGRQNGKGVIVEARELGGLYLLNEPLILHTAHEVKTSGEAFLRLIGPISDHGEFSRRVKRVNRSHGEEGIELLPTPTIILGAGGRKIRRSVAPRLRFLARSRVGGRGFTGRVVILDEAFELAEESMAALLPTMSAQPNPQLWYTSTPPDRMKDHNARVLARVRARGRAGNAPRLVYLEWSAGERSELDREQLAALRSDRRAWAMANPALGIRMSEEFVESELGALDDRSFEVERLGIGDWPVEAGAGWQVIGEEQWSAREDRLSQVLDPVAFAADVTPLREWGSIAVAGRRADGLLHVEVVEHQPRTSWMVPWLLERIPRLRPCAVVVDGAGESGSLIAPLEAADVEVVKPTFREMAQACGGFVEAVTDSGTLRHLGQVELAIALAGAQKRPLGDSWAWSRRDSSVDISPLVAATLALWGHATRGHIQPETVPSPDIF